MLVCLGAWSRLHNGHHKSFVRMNVIGFVSMSDCFKGGTYPFACKFLHGFVVFMGHQTSVSVSGIKRISMFIMLSMKQRTFVRPNFFLNTFRVIFFSYKLFHYFIFICIKLF